MRPLTTQETKILFDKLGKFIGENIRKLIDRPDGNYCFRLHRERVFYVAEETMKLAANTSHANLASLGVCFGKFTKNRKFMLKITCLDYLAPYAKYKVHVKPSSEQSFLYGNHVMKAGLGRITDGTPRNAGVVIYSMSDVPLGFGAAAMSTTECRKCSPMSIVAFHHADLGEYIRSEEELT